MECRHCLEVTRLLHIRDLLLTSLVLVKLQKMISSIVVEQMRPILSALPVILVRPTWACRFSNVKRLFITNKCKSYNNKVKEAQSNKDEKRLEALRQERAAIEDFQPDFAGKEYLIDRQLKPEARGDVLNQLRTAGIHPTSMIDISDGLASALKHICEKSHCGCRIYEKNIPIDYQTAATCEEFNMNLTTAALNGGEDYELLFTVPIGDHEKIDKMENIRQIGYITKENLGSFLIARDGNEFELKAQGWPITKGITHLLKDVNIGNFLYKSLEE